MLPKTLLFFWSKGANTRRKIIKLLHECEKKDSPCFINMMAKELDLTHVAIKKHTDLLQEEKFIEAINPSGKPMYLVLTRHGNDVYKELTNKKGKTK